MRKAALLLALFVPFLTALADERLPELPAGNAVYHNVTVWSVTATDVFISSDQGMANVKLKDLDPAWQKHFHYDAATAGQVERNQTVANRLFTSRVANWTEVPSSFANAPAAAGESGDPREYLRSNYNLQLTLQNSDSVSGSLRLGAVTNTGPVDDYLRAMVVECKKYPPGFFSRAGVSEMVLCGALDLGNAPVAGLFDQQHRKIYLQYHWCELGSRCRKTFHAFHHELGHALQTASWGDGHSDWPEWAALNPPGFSYGGGGDRELMADPEKNWGSWSTNQPGILNAYSATAPWEDRSEVMAALMNDGDRVNLRAYCLRDPIIQKKVEMMSGLLSQFCGAGGSKYFWERAVASLAAQPAASPASDQPRNERPSQLQADPYLLSAP